MITTFRIRISANRTKALCLLVRSISGLHSEHREFVQSITSALYLLLIVSTEETNFRCSGGPDFKAFLKFCLIQNRVCSKQELQQEEISRATFIYPQANTTETNFSRGNINGLPLNHRSTSHFQFVDRWIMQSFF